MIAKLRNWLDRDWEGRGYIPTFAFAQKLFWASPFFIVCLIGELAGAKQGDKFYDLGLPIGLALCIIPFSWSLIRWLKGYARPEWHEEQIRKRKKD